MTLSPRLYLIGITLMIALTGCAKDEILAPAAKFEKPDAALMRMAGDPPDLPKGAGLGQCTLNYTNLRRDYADVADRNALLQRYVSRLVGAKQSTPAKKAEPSAPGVPTS
jgi:hypothetical protein